MLASVTVTAAVPLWPPLVAVTVAVPTTRPVTRPVAETVATAPLLVVHVTAPLVGRPFASLRMAVSCAVVATCTLAAAGLTVTVATGAGGGQAETAGLHTAALPTLAYNPRLFSTLTVACSARKAKPLPSSRSLAPAGVT